MAGLSQIIRKHVDAAVSEAGQHGYTPPDVARTMLSFVVQIHREHQDIEALRQELQSVVDNLDPDQEYEFMRP